MLAAVRCASRWRKQHLQQIKDHSKAENERKASEKKKLSEIKKKLGEKRKSLSLEVRNNEGEIHLINEEFSQIRKPAHSDRF